MKLSMLRWVALFVGAATASAGANAARLLTEDFSGTTPGTYGSAIPGSVFAVSTANIDIVGQLNGSFFSCVDNPGGNCLDLVGNSGAGGIVSTPTFAVTAGDTYTVKFGAILQGYDPGQGNTTFAVGLGSLSQVESLNGTAQQFTVVFTPTVSESSAALAFTTIIPGDGVHGAVLDNITLDQTAPAGAIPEPASWALMLAGFGVVGGVLRRRATTVRVAA